MIQVDKDFHFMSHSSSQRLQSALCDFIEQESSGAMLLRGEWGAGKTFACKKILENSTTLGGKLSYSYVSLYGLSKIDDIFARIVLGWSGGKTAKVPGWLKDFAGHGANITRGLADMVKAGSAANAIGTAAIGLLVKNALIVFDDLERRDSTLSIESVLGAVSHLVESKNCRVIFIANDDALPVDEKKRFDKQKEKIFDSEYLYAPSVLENAKLICEGANFQCMISPLEKLRVCNLRVIHRVDASLNLIRRKLGAKNSKSLVALLENAAVLAILHFAFRDKVDLQTRQPMSLLQSLYGREDKTDASESQQLIQKAEYQGGTGDGEIVRFLLTGSADWEELQRLLNRAESEADRRYIRDSAQEALQRGLRNFQQDRETFVGSIEPLFQENAESLSPNTLEWAADVLKKLGCPRLSRNWLDRWARSNIPLMSDGELRDALLGVSSYPKDLSPLFQSEVESRKKIPDFETALTTRFLENVIDETELQFLSKSPVAKYAEWLQTSKSENVRAIVRKIFKSSYGKSGAEGQIAKKMLTALNRVSKVSKFNKIRCDMMKAALPRGNPRRPTPR